MRSDSADVVPKAQQPPLAKAGKGCWKKKEEKKVNEYAEKMMMIMFTMRECE